ncbi:hypothetical protein BC833DRAFT_286742 [Globomyces pollinis-pini]|nr:hypothetical protein BC833DRAFT_286742 [Globomyces pollinis-pini]
MQLKELKLDSRPNSSKSKVSFNLQRSGGNRQEIKAISEEDPIVIHGPNWQIEPIRSDKYANTPSKVLKYINGECRAEQLSLAATPPPILNQEFNPKHTKELTVGSIVTVNNQYYGSEGVTQNHIWTYRIPEKLTELPAADSALATINKGRFNHPSSSRPVSRCSEFGGTQTTNEFRPPSSHSFVSMNAVNIEKLAKKLFGEDESGHSHKNYSSPTPWSETNSVITIKERAATALVRKPISNFNRTASAPARRRSRNQIDENPPNSYYSTPKPPVIQPRPNESNGYILRSKKDTFYVTESELPQVSQPVSRPPSQRSRRPESSSIYKANKPDVPRNVSTPGLVNLSERVEMMSCLLPDVLPSGKENHKTIDGINILRRSVDDLSHPEYFLSEMDDKMTCIKKVSNERQQPEHLVYGGVIHVVSGGWIDSDEQDVMHSIPNIVTKNATVTLTTIRKNAY